MNGFILMQLEVGDSRCFSRLHAKLCASVQFWHAEYKVEARKNLTLTQCRIIRYVSFNLSNYHGLLAKVATLQCHFIFFTRSNRYLAIKQALGDDIKTNSNATFVQC